HRGPGSGAVGFFPWVWIDGRERGRPAATKSTFGSRAGTAGRLDGGVCRCQQASIETHPLRGRDKCGVSYRLDTPARPYSWRGEATVLRLGAASAAGNGIATRKLIWP